MIQPIYDYTIVVTKPWSLYVETSVIESLDNSIRSQGEILKRDFYKREFPRKNLSLRKNFGKNFIRIVITGRDSLR